MLQEIKKYYPLYLTLHTHPSCIFLHVLGQIVTYLYLSICLLTSSYAMALLTPFIVYPFAWAGHLLFEKNKPAAWSNPILAKICDHIMLFDVFTGKIKLWKK